MSSAVRIEMGTPCGDPGLAFLCANHGQNINCIEEHSHTYETRSMICEYRRKLIYGAS